MQAEKAIRKAMGRKTTTLTVEDVMGETPLDNPKLKQIVEQVTRQFYKHLIIFYSIVVFTVIRDKIYGVFAQKL
jgi:ERCC4-related helicase